MSLILDRYARVVQQKKVFDPAMLEIILASLVVEKWHFQRYMYAMEICDNFSIYILRSIQFGSIESCFIRGTDVSGLITFLNGRNRNNKT